MKLLDILLESDLSERETKKANTVYKLFKNGKVFVHINGPDYDGEDLGVAEFSYKLSDDKKIYSVWGVTNVLPNEIYVKEENKLASIAWIKDVSKSITNKFGQFGIVFITPKSKNWHVETYKDSEEKSN